MKRDILYREFTPCGVEKFAWNFNFLFMAHLTRLVSRVRARLRGNTHVSTLTVSYYA